MKGNFGYTEDGRIGSVTDYRLWRRILNYSRPYAGRLAVAVVLSLLITGLTLSLPLLLRQGVDRYMMNTLLPAGARVSGIVTLSLVYVGCSLAIFVLGFSQTVLLETIAQSVMHVVRQRLFSHLLGLDIGFFQHQPAGRLVTRLTNDIQNMHEMFTSVIVTLFNDLLRISGILLVLWLMNRSLALVMTLFLPLSLLVIRTFSRLARERFRALRHRLSRLNGFMQETIASLAVVQIYDSRTRCLRDYRQLNRDYLDRAFAQIRLFGFFLPLTEFLSALATGLILWYGGVQVLDHRMSVGELVAFLSYIRLFFQPMRELSQKYSIVQSALASAERIFETLDTRSRLEVREPIADPAMVRGEILIDRVEFGYRPDEPVLRGVSCRLVPGRMTALVGPTGSGKSTLASLLVRFSDPDRGRILLDGIDLRHYPLARLRQQVGMIMQEVMLVPGTVRENIEAGSPVSRAHLDHLARITGLDQVLSRLGRGWETRIGEGGQDLSAGEKQLIGFVRILARDPAVLIFDEATAALDVCGEILLEKALVREFQHRSVLVIAHRLSTVRRADTILVMDRGRLKERGTHQELLARGGLYARLAATDLVRDSGEGDG